MTEVRMVETKRTRAVRRITEDTIDKIWYMMDFEKNRTKIARVIGLSGTTVQFYARVLEAVHAGKAIPIGHDSYCEKAVISYCKHRGLKYTPKTESTAKPEEQAPDLVQLAAGVLVDEPERPAAPEERRDAIKWHKADPGNMPPYGVPLLLTVWDGRARLCTGPAYRIKDYRTGRDAISEYFRHESSPAHLLECSRVIAWADWPEAWSGENEGMNG